MTNWLLSHGLPILLRMSFLDWVSLLLALAGLSMSLAGLYVVLSKIIQLSGAHGVRQWIAMLMRPGETSCASIPASILQSKTLKLRSKGKAWTVPIFTLLLCCVAMGTVRIYYWLDVNANYPVQTLHNVYVSERIDSERMKMKVQDPDTHEWREFAFVSCGDYPITPEIKTGTTLTLLKYEERSDCQSVKKDKLGYILLRDEVGKPIIREK